jgi:hypothetical protein
MKNKLPLLLLASICIASCNVAYRPSMVNTPLFTEKGEVAFGASFNNVQAAYALTNHVGIMANGYLQQSNVEINETGEGGTGYLGEAGIGYFTLLDNQHLVFETYAGAGYGGLNLYTNFRENNVMQKREFDANGTKIFIQPGIGYKLPYFEVSGAIRYTNINYNNIQLTNYTDARMREDNLQNLGNTSFTFLEPTVTIRAGFRNVKFQVQYINSVKLTSADINYTSEVINFGVFIKVPTRKL